MEIPGEISGREEERRESAGRVGEGERIVTLSGSRFGQYYRELRCVRVRRLAAETLNDVGIYSRLSVGLDRPDLDSRNHLARSRRRRRRAFTGPPRRPAVLPIGGNGRSFHPRTIQRRRARPRAHETVRRSGSHAGGEVGEGNVAGSGERGIR